MEYHNQHLVLNTNEECKAKVKEVVKEIGADVPDGTLDRIHRIGKKTIN